MENNFIVLISEPTENTNYEILISLNFGQGYVSDPIKFKDSSFIHYDNFESYYHGFESHKEASAGKFKIERFLENYLNK